MSAVDVALWGIIAAIVGGLIIWLIFYAFSDQTKPPSNLTEETLKRLVGSTGRATSDVTESTGTVLVNSEEYSAKTLKEIIPKGTGVRVTETDGLTLLVEKA
jgi:membrane protein implicated in regulation of membrane protease activity